MVKIINNTDNTLQPSAQSKIRDAAANMGISEVIVGGNDGVFDLYDQYENYLFSIDTDGDIIFEK